MGTHPIFESDFDCLTDTLQMLRSIVRRLNRSSHKLQQTSTWVSKNTDAFNGELILEKVHGTGLHFNSSKGFGTVKNNEVLEDGSDILYCLSSEIINFNPKKQTSEHIKTSFQEGERLEYDIVLHEKNYFAVNVTA